MKPPACKRPDDRLFYAEGYTLLRCHLEQRVCAVKSGQGQFSAPGFDNDRPRLARACISLGLAPHIYLHLHFQHSPNYTMAAIELTSSLSEIIRLVYEKLSASAPVIDTRYQFTRHQQDTGQVALSSMRQISAQWVQVIML